MLQWGASYMPVRCLCRQIRYIVFDETYVKEIPAIKFDNQLLAIFKVFQIYEVYFCRISLPPLTKRFKICFKSIFESIPVQ